MMPGSRAGADCGAAQVGGARVGFSDSMGGEEFLVVFRSAERKDGGLLGGAASEGSQQRGFRLGNGRRLRRSAQWGGPHFRGFRDVFRIIGGGSAASGGSRPVFGEECRAKSGGRATAGHGSSRDWRAHRAEKYCSLEQLLADGVSRSAHGRRNAGQRRDEWIARDPSCFCRCDRRVYSVSCCGYFQDANTANIEEPFVVFLIGMRINQLWALHRWIPWRDRWTDDFRAFPEPRQGISIGAPMDRLAGSDAGAVLEVIRRARGLCALRVRFHLPAWKAFNKNVGADGSVGSGTRPILWARSSMNVCTPTCLASAWPTLGACRGCGQSRNCASADGRDEPTGRAITQQHRLGSS